jgi:hypothetical protein
MTSAKNTTFTFFYQHKYMKISGFTFVRNALKYDYPVVEAITSVLPLCDEFVVCAGNSDDGTEELIMSLQQELNNVKKTGGGMLNSVKIIHSVWDDSLRTGGKVLAVETDKAFDAVSPDSDWAIYVQADEAIHEQYLPAIRAAMEQYLHDPQVECLVLKYLHFYGSYCYVGDTRNWYRREIRIIRNDKSIRSYKDAQGFRRNGKKLAGKLIDAYVYHYGFVRNPRLQQQKCNGVKRFWNPSTDALEPTIVQATEFDYSQIGSLSMFTGTHPKVMQKRISAMDWVFQWDPHRRHLTLKERLLGFVERITGKRLFEFRNYRLI